MPVQMGSSNAAAAISAAVERAFSHNMRMPGSHPNGMMTDPMRGGTGGASSDAINYGGMPQRPANVDGHWHATRAIAPLLFSPETWAATVLSAAAQAAGATEHGAVTTLNTAPNDVAWWRRGVERGHFMSANGCSMRHAYPCMHTPTYYELLHMAGSFGMHSL